MSSPQPPDGQQARDDVIAAARKLHQNTLIPPHLLNDCPTGLSDTTCDCGYADLAFALLRLDAAVSSTRYEQETQ